MQAIRAVAEHVRPAGLPARPGYGGPEALAGLRAIQGQILPVLDPREALGLPQDGLSSADIVVAAAGLPSFVVPAQAVDGVVRLTDAAVHEATAWGGVPSLAAWCRWAAG
jgi:chemotaxis signal transduction protein